MTCTACSKHHIGACASPVCNEEGVSGSTAVESRDPGHSSLAANERFHLYLPWSRRGHGGYPPPGAIAVCGEVKRPGVRPAVSADHPQACSRCTELFDQMEQEWIEDRDYEEGRDR